MANRGAGLKSKSLKVSVQTWGETGHVIYRNDIGNTACRYVPICQHVEYSPPCFRIDAGIRIPVEAASNGRHQHRGCVHPVGTTQRVGKLLQANFPNLREPIFATPVNLGIKMDGESLNIAVKSDANSCIMSQAWIVARIHFNASAFNSGISY